MLLLVVATVVAGMIWRLACATLCFVSDLLIPLLKAVLVRAHPMSRRAARGGGRGPRGSGSRFVFWR